MSKEPQFDIRQYVQRKIDRVRRLRPDERREKTADDHQPHRNEPKFKTRTGGNPARPSNASMMQLTDPLMRYAAGLPVRLNKISGAKLAAAVADVTTRLRHQEYLEKQAEEARQELPYRDRAEVYALDDQGRLLGGRYKQDGTFGVFGGGVDDGEDALAAAAREFAEESGYELLDPQEATVDPVEAEWKPPYASPKQAERAKKYRGSRTRFITGRLGPKFEGERGTDTDHPLEQVGPYTVEQALEMMRDDELGQRRQQVLESLLQQKTAGEEREPQVDRHSSSPSQSLRPRSEVILFTRDGVYAIDKGDYLLMPGGGVDDGEQARDSVVREALEECGRQPINIHAAGTVEALWPKDSGNDFWDTSDFDGERTYFFRAVDAGDAGGSHPDREEFTVIDFDTMLKRLDELIEDPEQSWARRNNEERRRLVADAKRLARVKDNLRPLKQAQAMEQPQQPMEQPQQQQVQLPTDMKRQEGDPVVKAQDFVRQLAQGQQQQQQGPSPAQHAQAPQNQPMAQKMAQEGPQVNNRAGEEEAEAVEEMLSRESDTVPTMPQPGQTTEQPPAGQLAPTDNQMQQQVQQSVAQKLAAMLGRVDQGDDVITNMGDRLNLDDFREDVATDAHDTMPEATEQIAFAQEQPEKLTEEPNPEHQTKQADVASFKPMKQHLLFTPDNRVVVRRLPDRRFALPTEGRGRPAPYEHPIKFVPREGIPEEGYHGYDINLHVGDTDDVPEGFEAVDPEEALRDFYASMGLSTNRRYRELDRARARAIVRRMRQVRRRQEEEAARAPAG